MQGLDVVLCSNTFIFILVVGWDHVLTEMPPATDTLSIRRMIEGSIWSADGLILTRKSNTSEKKLSKWRFIHYKSHAERLGSETWTLEGETSDQPPDIRPGRQYHINLYLGKHEKEKQERKKDRKEEWRKEIRKKENERYGISLISR